MLVEQQREEGSAGGTKRREEGGGDRCQAKGGGQVRGRLCQVTLLKEGLYCFDVGGQVGSGGGGRV